MKFSISKPLAGTALLAGAGLVCLATVRLLRAGQPPEESVAVTATTQPQHTNRLIHSTSPYLLQHAHNPVDWYPWGPEALNKARQEDKPIFLSVGYAACHWCHVMEHESFENQEVAAVLNQHFVCIKVDREERPDIDDLYMQATLAMTGSGGWPMSVFLTPDLKPFLAGTYFPRTQFLQLLGAVGDAWENRRKELDTQAGHVADYLKQWAAGPKAGETAISREMIANNARVIADHFDARLGGISGGGTNKFPPSMSMDLLLREYRRTGQKRYLELVELTLERMAAGGIYDQLGGGIHRYSTDLYWLVPHFEKMLYDQALVADIYLHAYQLTRKPLYARVAGEILDWVLRDLRSPEGGFYSTLDADSEGLEGKYYVWTMPQVEQVLGADDARLFCAYYDVTEAGNWDERFGHAPPGPKNILNVKRDMETVAKLHGLPMETLRDRLRAAREKLLAERSQRVPPGLDDKILTSWNGMMIASLARGYRVLDEPRYRDGAVAAAGFVLKNLRKDGRLLRSYRRGKAHLAGYLDDYANLIDGLLWLYETTFELRWLETAAELNDLAVEHFFDEKGGAFFYTADDHEELLARAKDSRDGATPSGNSVMAMNLLRLAVLLNRPDLREKADSIFKTFAGQAAGQPGSMERLLAAADFRLDPPREVAVVGPPDDPRTGVLLRTVYQAYVPNKVVALLDPTSPAAAEAARRVPLLAEKKMLDGAPTAYVCRNYACQAPTADPAKLAEQLQQ